MCFNVKSSIYLFSCEDEYIGRFSNLHWCTFKNITFKNRKAPRFSKMRIKVVPFNHGRWKKRVFEKVLFCVWKGDFIYILSRVKRASSRNQAEEIFRIFLLQDLVKKAKFSTPGSIYKRLQSQFLIDFFF